MRFCIPKGTNRYWKKRKKKKKKMLPTKLSAFPKRVHIKFCLDSNNVDAVSPMIQIENFPHKCLNALSDRPLLSVGKAMQRLALTQETLKQVTSS